MPSKPDPVEELLTSIADSCFRSARDLHEIRNLIAVLLVMGLLAGIAAIISALI